MTKVLQWVGSIIALILLSFVALKDVKTPNTPLGSIDRNSEYFSTTTVVNAVAGTFFISPTSTATSAASTSAYISKTLGSVVITSTTAANGFSILDANGYVTDTIAVFPASPTVGTYTFDRVIRYGLVVVVPASFTGNFITTWR